MDIAPNSTNGRSMAAFVDALQARGRYSFTRSEALSTGGFSAAVLDASLGRLKRRGRIACLRRSFFVIVPLEYLEARCPPASWFIDDLMRFLGQPYYVGLLSAAAIHGAAHQQPMDFQVMTDRATRPSKAGRVRITFHKSRCVGRLAAASVQTETGTMQVSTPEVTAMDLVRFTVAAGGLNNVITVLSELAEKIDPDALRALAPHYAVSDVQRAGYLLELLGRADLCDPLAEWLSHRRYRPILLVPKKTATKAQAAPRWRVIPNEAPEIDL
jgi:predicted transcriptional regulator of viral defense system